MNPFLLRKCTLAAALCLGAAAPAWAATPHGKSGVTPQAPSDELESFFRGRIDGAGQEKDAAHSAARTVRFSAVGKPYAGGLRLAYDVTFSDGEKQHKVWTFQRIGAGRYIGRRSDLVGDAQVSLAGNDIELVYKAIVPTSSGSHELNFDEQFIRTGPKTMLNRLTAKYLFVTVANGEINLQKIGG